MEPSILWDCLGIEITVACESVGRARQMCASKVSVGPVDDQPFAVTYVGREG